MFSTGLNGSMSTRQAPASVPEPRWETKVLLVDDSKLHRDNLAAVLVLNGMAAPSVAWDIPSLVASLGGITPDVVLLDLTTRDSRPLLRAVVDICPAAQVIAVGASEEEEDEVVACAEAGVAGYLMRTDPLETLLVLIEDVAAGRSACPPRVAAILLRRLSALAAQAHPPVKELVLTAREAQVLPMLELGRSNQDIATHLGIAVHTVKNHVHRLLTKLGVSSREEAAALSRTTRVEVVSQRWTRSRST